MDKSTRKCLENAVSIEADILFLFVLGVFSVCLRDKQAGIDIFVLQINTVCMGIIAQMNSTFYQFCQEIFLIIPNRKVFFNEGYDKMVQR